MNVSTWNACQSSKGVICTSCSCQHQQIGIAFFGFFSSTIVFPLVFLTVFEDIVVLVLFCTRRARLRHSGLLGSLRVLIRFLFDAIRSRGLAAALPSRLDLPVDPQTHLANCLSRFHTMHLHLRRQSFRDSPHIEWFSNMPRGFVSEIDLADLTHQFASKACLMAMGSQQGVATQICRTKLHRRFVLQISIPRFVAEIWPAALLGDSIYRLASRTGPVGLPGDLQICLLAFACSFSLPTRPSDLV